jgi:hypothetical protein
MKGQTRKNRRKIRRGTSVAFSPQANYTDRASDRSLSAKLVPNFTDKGCRVVSATESPAVNSVFLTEAATFSFK